MTLPALALHEPPSSAAMQDDGPGWRALLAYGLPALPLAFVALPIYVHVPQLYAQHHAMPLALVGAVLLLARIWDAVIDPLIGVLSDRVRARRGAILVAVPLLVAGLWGLLRPPAQPAAGWLLGMLLLVYLGYSLASVNHHAWGAEIVDAKHARTRVVAVREGLALVGVVLAAILPAALAPDLPTGLAGLALVFAVLMPLAALACIGVPEPRRDVGDAPRWQALRAAWRNARFVRLLGVFALSGIAAAIPASLVLFFVADVLQAERWQGAFLALYFVAAAAGLPLWVWASRRWGKLRAWAFSMLMAVAVFVWAASLGAGDAWAFAVICVLSGVALGADLALPPSVLADIAADDATLGAGALFGWWNFVAKLNLALAAGLSLPLLQWLGYAPGIRVPEAVLPLALVYAAVPAVLKLLAAALLWRAMPRIAS